MVFQFMIKTKTYLKISEGMLSTPLTVQSLRPITQNVTVLDTPQNIALTTPSPSYF